MFFYPNHAKCVAETGYQTGKVGPKVPSLKLSLLKQVELYCSGKCQWVPPLWASSIKPHFLVGLPSASLFLFYLSYCTIWQDSNSGNRTTRRKSTAEISSLLRYCNWLTFVVDTKVLIIDYEVTYYLRLGLTLELGCSPLSAHLIWTLVSGALAYIINSCID